MKKKSTRRLTVYDIYFPKYRCEPHIVPYIRLCGKWLQELGFSQGQKILITTEKNKIIITPDVTKEEQEAA